MKGIKILFFIAVTISALPAQSATREQALSQLQRTQNMADLLSERSVSVRYTAALEFSSIHWDREMLHQLRPEEIDRLKELDNKIFNSLLEQLNSSDNMSVIQKLAFRDAFIQYFDLDKENPRLLFHQPDFQRIRANENLGVFITRQFYSLENKQLFVIRLNALRAEKGLTDESSFSRAARLAVNDYELSSEHRSKLISGIDKDLNIPDCLKAGLCETVNAAYRTGRMLPSTDGKLIRLGLNGFKATGVFGAVGVGAALLKQASTSDSSEANQID